MLEEEEGEGGEGEGGASCLVAKQAVEFPQVPASILYNNNITLYIPTATTTVHMYITSHLG